MTHNKASSGFLGTVNLPPDMRLLDGVRASAAFLDSNEMALGQPARFLAAVGLHLLNLDWGTDIDNVPNLKDDDHAIHTALPFPLYYADALPRQLRNAPDHGPHKNSVFIRLSDDGSSDNLGAYDLIASGFNDVVTANHSYDGKGQVQDLCRLHNELRLRKGRLLLIQGLQNFTYNCSTFLGDSDDGRSFRNKLSQ